MYRSKLIIKGAKIELIPATLDDRRKVYEWCFLSETTKSHSGSPEYTEIPIPIYEEFCDEYYEEYYFTGDRPKDGRGFLILHDGEPIGLISYCAFHLKPSIAELDIWMRSESNCGKGFGTDALIARGDFLNKTMGFCMLIIAPSSKNVRAVKSYEKAGFKKSGIARRDFLLDEYVSLYGDGDYGINGTVNLLKRFNAKEEL